uniref:Uncharacterized protein n=1 Tax=Rhizophora mucronata TaxID=61149 RepID=A0A2P2NYH6_RHIMU
MSSSNFLHTISLLTRVQRMIASSFQLRRKDGQVQDLTRT